MNKKTEAVFSITGWDEKPYSEIDGGPKLSKVAVTKSYTGGMAGEGVLEYIMIYPTSDSAEMYGLERFTGSIDGKAGSFVLEHTGAFKDGVVQSTWKIVPGSGTGALKDLQGEIDFSAGHAAEYPIILNHNLQ